MPSPEEIARRKSVKQALRLAESERIRSTLPILPMQMRSLFNFVDEQLAEADCDGTLHNTLVFLEQHNLATEPVLQWLQNAGANCDCEVIANAEERFLLAFPEVES
jgi:hypothetical protein